MNGEETLYGMELIVILCGVAMGTLARFITLRIDSRQMPSYPSGYMIHLVTGFISSALGSVAIPALLSKDFTAFTFLALALQHLRDVRKQECDSLNMLEASQHCTRGEGYIDGIAKTYEARSYISMLTALGTVLILTVAGLEKTLPTVLLGTGSGAVLIYLLVRFTKSKRIGDICDIHQGQVEIRDGVLYVDGIDVTMRLGTKRSQDLFREGGVAFVIKARQEKHRLIVEQPGQRKALLFDAVRSFGSRQYQFTERSLKDGRVVIAFVPILKDVQGIMATLHATPILESVRKRRRGA